MILFVLFLCSSGPELSKISGHRTLLEFLIDFSFYVDRFLQFHFFFFPKIVFNEYIVSLLSTLGL